MAKIEREPLEIPTSPHAIIFDWKRTLYDPDSKTLIDGANELLETLSQTGAPLFLIGKGEEEMYREADRLGVSRYFDGIRFVEGEKDPAYFAPYIDRFNPSATYVIGDRTRSELQAGKSLGATTIWVRQGKFAGELPTPETSPDHEISSLTGLNELLQKIIA